MRRKRELLNFNDFMSGNYKTKDTERLSLRLLNHFEDNKYAYSIGTMTLAFVLTGAIDFSGLDAISAATDGGMNIDEKAKALYQDKFMTLAKWFIIGKGSWDTVNKTIKEDFDGAKKSFMQYLIIFVLLLGFPWSLDQIQAIFAS